MTEFSGRTISEAIETGLETLNLTREEAQIEVIDEGRGGVFGLGAKEALVRIQPRSDEASPGDEASGAPEAVDEPILAPAIVEDEAIESEDINASLQETVAEEPDNDGSQDGENVDVEVEEVVVAEIVEASAVVEEEIDDDEGSPSDNEVLLLCEEFLQELLDHMGLRTTVEATIKEPDEYSRERSFILNIEGEDLGILIGRRGETLESIQYLVRLYANRNTHTWPRIEVDVEHYKERRIRSLERLAETMAERAVRSEHEVVMEAMPPRERRIVHLALRDREDVYTESIGEGENRKVTINPVL